MSASTIHGMICTRYVFSQPHSIPSTPIQGSRETSKSSGIAMVSNGMISVASTIDRITSRPCQLRKVKEKAATEQITSDRLTVTTVTKTEFIMNRPIGARSKAA